MLRLDEGDNVILKADQNSVRTHKVESVPPQLSLALGSFPLAGLETTIASDETRTLLSELVSCWSRQVNQGLQVKLFCLPARAVCLERYAP